MPDEINKAKENNCSILPKKAWLFADDNEKESVTYAIGNHYTIFR